MTASPKDRAALVLIAGVTLTVCTTAHANGRFPEAQLIESVPGSDGRTLFLRTTFGILVSQDAGAHWRWICERALGYEGQWDPPIAVTRDGRLWVGLEGGLVSTRDGCTVERAAELDGQTVKDLTVDAKGEAVWAITGAPTKGSFVWKRAPNQRFRRLAEMGETNLMTIEVAPVAFGRPERVYVSGQPYTTIRGRIYRSDDGGRTFAPVSPDDLAASGPMFIGSVDPVDSNRLLLRHLHAKGSDLYLSTDGGRTLTEVLSMKSAMFGFAKSADGKTIWAGSGLPEHGVLRSTDRGEHFEVVARHGVLCLHAAGAGGLFACENSATFGAPAVAVARDGVGRSFTPLARFPDVDGPVACPTQVQVQADASANLCGDAWSDVRATFWPSDAGAPSGEDSGALPAGASAPMAAPRPTPPAPKPTRSGGCGCDVVGDAHANAGWLGLLVAGCALARATTKLRGGSR